MKVTNRTHIGRPRSVGMYINQIMNCTNQAKPTDGHRLTGINIRFTAERVKLILKKDTPKNPKVAYFEAATITYALWMAASALTSKRVPWRDDEWEMRRRSKP